MDSNETVVCKTCHRALPDTWAGIDQCPWCLYLTSQAPTRTFRPPTYRSPLEALDRNHDGNV